jgi:integrase
MSTVVPFVRTGIPTQRQGFKGREQQEITKELIGRLATEPATGSDVYVQDTEVAGFKLRRDRHGRITFMFIGRVRGEGAKHTLVNKQLGPARGKQALTVAAARAKAQCLRERLSEGVNPVEEQRQRARALEAAAEAHKITQSQAAIFSQWTIQYALDDYLRDRAARVDPRERLRPRTVKFYKDTIRNVGSFAKREVATISTNEVRAALQKLTTPALQSQARRTLSVVIGHAISQMELDRANPVSRLKRKEFARSKPRTAHVAEDELGAWFAKLATVTNSRSPKLGATIRNHATWVVLYGMRKEESSVTEWPWIDRARKTITIPAETAKTNKARVLPLTPWAMAILDAQEGKHPQWVFPGRSRVKPLSDGRTALKAALGKEFYLHKLRRTLMTHFALQISDGVRLKAIVGHADASVTEEYIQRSMPKMRADLETFHSWMNSLIKQHQFELANPKAVAEINAKRAKEQAEKPAEHWPVAVTANR